MCFKNVLCFGNIYNITIQKSIIQVYYGKPWQRNVVIKQLWLQIVSPSVVTVAKSLLMRNDFQKDVIAFSCRLWSSAILKLCFKQNFLSPISIGRQGELFLVGRVLARMFEPNSQNVWSWIPTSVLFNEIRQWLVS